MCDKVITLRKKWPDKIPCVVRYSEQEIKLLMPLEFTVAQLQFHIRRQLLRRGLLQTNKQKALFLFKHKTLLSGTTALSDLDTDGTQALCITCEEENVFGAGVF